MNPETRVFDRGACLESVPTLPALMSCWVYVPTIFCRYAGPMRLTCVCLCLLQRMPTPETTGESAAAAELATELQRLHRLWRLAGVGPLP